MAEARHGKLTTSEGIHIPYQWSYANAGARTGASGFVAADLGKFARQADDNTIWILTATTPTWVQVGGAGHDAVTLAGDDYLTILGQEITANDIDLADDVTGILPIANGGTSGSTAQLAINALTAVSGATPEHVLTADTVTGNAIFKAAAAGGGLNLFPADGRLTLTTGVPVTTADVSTAGTIYYTPYLGNRIALYDGVSAWTIVAFTECSLALTATANKPYDVFIYNNSGTATLETCVWNNDTTRVTALAYQNGVLVKDGVTTRRYVGSFYASATDKTDDSAAARLLWNMYNRVPRFAKAVDDTNSWTYSTNAWRASDNNTTAGVGRVTCMLGLAESLVTASHVNVVINDAGSHFASTGIGIDATNANSAQQVGGIANTSYEPAVAHYAGYPATGYHYIQAIENCDGVGTFTWAGDYGLAYFQTGMVVTIDGM